LHADLIKIAVLWQYKIQRIFDAYLPDTVLISWLKELGMLVCLLKIKILVVQRLKSSKKNKTLPNTLFSKVKPTLLYNLL
jgi:hypothetical protein